MYISHLIELWVLYNAPLACRQDSLIHVHTHKTNACTHGYTCSCDVIYSFTHHVHEAHIHLTCTLPHFKLNQGLNCMEKLTWYSVFNDFVTALPF